MLANERLFNNIVFFFLFALKQVLVWHTRTAVPIIRPDDHLKKRGLELDRSMEV